MLTQIALLNVRYATPQISVIEIRGEVNSSAESQLMEAYNLAQQPCVRAIVLNFEKMQFMNSSGIGLLITLLIRATRQGQKLTAAGFNPHFQRIFELTRLREAIPFYPSEEQALKAMEAQIEEKLRD
jgi:anti-sigma B factor antagonist